MAGITKITFEKIRVKHQELKNIIDFFEELDRNNLVTLDLLKSLWSADYKLTNFISGLEEKFDK